MNYDFDASIELTNRYIGIVKSLGMMILGREQLKRMDLSYRWLKEDNLKGGSSWWIMVAREVAWARIVVKEDD